LLNEYEYFSVKHEMNRTQEATMPVIALWLGIPIIVLGGGYAIVHFMH
jgi:hypothetical protein